ncbi:putative F-box domain-containing protein [Tanacetum coccineum]
MSDNIPFEIQVEIIKNFPIISLIRFRSVSKPWRSLIDSFEFISDYNVRHTQSQQHLFVSYFDSDANERKHVSIVDDDVFPKNKFPLIPPMSVQLFKYEKIVGCAQGLFCLYDCILNAHDTASIWNPYIRKSIDINIPVVNLPYMSDRSPLDIFYGFGVCPITSDPKIIKITYFYREDHGDYINDCTWQVDVFELSTGDWSSGVIDWPCGNCRLSSDQVDTVGFIHWIAVQDKPDHMWDSLVLVRSQTHACSVWMIGPDDKQIFRKLFTVDSRPEATIFNVLGFSNSGEPIFARV